MAAVAPLPACLDPTQWITPAAQLDQLFESVEEEKYGDFVKEALHPISEWFFAFKQLEILPEKIPPLPEKLPQILDGDCPFFKGKKVRETHVLMLIPSSFKTLKKFIDHLRTLSPKCTLWDESRALCMDLSYPVMHWVLMTKSVIPGSEHKSYRSQERVIKQINQKHFVNYEVPALIDVVTLLFLHYVGTGKKILHRPNKKDYTWTFVREGEPTNRLNVGEVTTSEDSKYQIQIHRMDEHQRMEWVGMATVRRLIN
jgi:hypothetical protein